jgi:plastocyanin
MSRRSTVALAATAALGVSALAGPAFAAEAGQATITTKGKGMKMHFSKAVTTVESGSTITFKNTTKGEPHTLSLVKPGLLPTTEKQMKACANLAKGSACFPLVKAHKVDLKTFDIGRPLYDAKGDGGFATMGSARKAGDSVFVAPKQSVQLKITAKAGTTLTYFCAVHPWMNGKIEVK